MTWLLDGKPLRKILVTRLRYLGDVVMTTPVLEVLRAGDPDLYLGYLAEWVHGRVLIGHPHVNRLHLLGSGRKKNEHGRRAHNTGGQSAWAIFKELRRTRYDLAVDLFFNPRSSWLLKLSGIPVRIGGTAGIRRHLFTHTVRPADFPPQLKEYLRPVPGGLGEHLGRLAPLRHKESRLDFLAYFQTWVEECPPGSGRSGSRIVKPRLTLPPGSSESVGIGPKVVIAPGSTWPEKEWARESWEQLIPRLQEATGATIDILQPPNRAGEFEFLTQGDGKEHVHLLPPLDLLEACRSIAGASLLISVDGGIMHAGVGLGVPTLALFGPTEPDLWFPYEDSGPYKVLTPRPSDAPLSTRIPDMGISTVLDAALALWNRDEGGTS